jgi:spectinomycin phosphotransferase
VPSEPPKRCAISPALEFVSAPIASGNGAVLRRIDSRHAVRAEPFIEGAAGDSGEFEYADDRRRMGVLIGRLHAASRHVPAGLPAPEDFSIPARGTLEEAVAGLDRPWNTGPYGEPARELLRARVDGVRQRLHSYDELVRSIRDSSEPWVLTHGEPHRANVMRVTAGGLRLVDWDATMVGPRERDLWIVLDRDRTGGMSTGRRRAPSS